MALTTDDLVSAVRRAAFLPDAFDLTATELLAMADDEIVTVTAELMRDAREEYGIAVEDTALTSATSYRIPRRALDRTVRSVSFLDESSREVPAHEIEATLGGRAALSSTWTRAYYFQSDSIVIVGTPPSGWSLRVRYTRRPSKLVAVASCAAIQKPGTTTLLPLSISQPNAQLATAMLVDIVRGDPPHDLMYVDRKVSAYTASTSITFDSSTPVVAADFVNRDTYTNDRIDYVCPRDQTCYPPLPEVGFPLLVAATARRVLEDIGDREAAQVAEATLEKRAKAARALVQPRNEQGSRAIIGRSSSLRTPGFGGGRRWR